MGELRTPQQHVQVHDANGRKSRRRVGWHRDAADPATFRKTLERGEIHWRDISFLRERYLRAAAPNGLLARTVQPRQT